MGCANYNAKKGSEVTFGIEGNVLFDIKDGKKQAICLLWSVEEFNAMRAQMQAEPFPAPPEPIAEAQTTTSPATRAASQGKER